MIVFGNQAVAFPVETVLELVGIHSQKNQSHAESIFFRFLFLVRFAGSRDLGFLFGNKISRAAIRRNLGSLWLTNENFE